MPTSKRVRLCVKDLYHQDVVEMIDREMRKYEIRVLDHPDDPDFAQAYAMLWNAFGEAGEMEREDTIRQFILDDVYQPTPEGTYFRYFLLVAKDSTGTIRGVRDGSVLINQSYSPDLCVVYLSHIYVTPEARGSVLSYWLRIAPTELAVQYIADLRALGKLEVPLPSRPDKYFGMRVNLVAEMEYWTPEEKLSLQRILFYGRGGFDVINPRHFPYRQPDFRDPDVIRSTGYQPKPFMLLLRRMGRERQATLPIEEAAGVMNLLYDEFETHCPREMLEGSLQVVLDRLEERAKTKSYVDLLPLPTGPKDLARLKRLFRYPNYKRYYQDDVVAKAYMAGGIKDKLAADPHYVDTQLAKIQAELESRPVFVYPNRATGFTWEGLAENSASMPPFDLSETGEFPFDDTVSVKGSLPVEKA